jgi:PAS domain S-box-containing protein
MVWATHTPHLVRRSLPRPVFVIATPSVYVRVFAGLALAIALVSMAGWGLNIAVFYTWGHAGPLSMPTSIGLALMCLATLARTSAPEFQWVSRLCALLGGGLPLAFFLHGDFRVGTDMRQLAPAPHDQTAFIAPATAFALVLLCIALLTIRRHVWTAHWLAAGSMLVASIAVLGYLFDVQALYQISNYATMSLPAAMAILVLSAAVLALRLDAGLMYVLAHPGPSQVLARRFLPLSVLAFLCIHWVGRLGYQYGLYTVGFQSVIVTLTGIVVIVVLTWQSIQQIQMAEAERSRAILRFRAAASASNAMVYEWDAESGEVERVCGLEEMTGYSVEEAESTAAWWRSLIHPEDIDRLQKEAARKFQIGETLTTEYRVRRKNGSYIHVHDSFLVLDAQDGTLKHAIGSTLDVTERKRREDELRNSNEDLRQFAYAAAHDLQEPLRMVTVFTQMLESAWKERLDENTRSWMGYIVEGAERMHALLSDLRVYTEMAQATPTREMRTDLNRALKKAMENLDMAILESDAKVSSDTLPEVNCREVYLVQLFQNLLSNSIKYRAGEPPLIHVSAERGRGEWLIAVRDNGIGIDPKYSSQIFGIFKRLNRKVPGTGMGLAICARVVERCGGRIWVESAPGQGATFKFTLPFL